jgi:AraC-like DNA-binding protein
MLADHTRQSKVLFSSIDNPYLNPIRLLALAVFTKWFVGLLRVFHCVYLGRDMGMGVAFAVLDVGVTVYVVLSLLRQRAFSEVDRTLVARIESESVRQNAQATSEPDKYLKSGLNDPTKARVRRKLEQVMGVGRLYRDNQLTLRALCDEIRENPHYVSQVINQEFGRNFYDYVNQHRIEHAKSALIADPEQSVLQIALDAGFNSKSTFNAAFREHVGCTPTAYRREHVSLAAAAPANLAD